MTLNASKGCDGKRRGTRSVLVVSLLGLVALGCRADHPSVDPRSQVGLPPFVQSASSKTETPHRPHVVFVVIDTLRADHVGAFGSNLELTPNIDSLAGESHVFAQALAPSSWTRPSIAAMLTSRYPTSLGLLDKAHALEDDAVTLPEVLDTLTEYQTLAVISNGNVSEAYGFDQGFDRFEWPHLRRRYAGDFPKPIAEGVTQKALEMIDERDPARPFFLFALYVDPHDPYLPHDGLLSREEPLGRFDGSRPQLKRLDRMRKKAEPADLDRVRHLYAGEVAYVDRWIGELMDGLRSRGLFDEVVLVLTADHGEGLWSHGLRGHGNDLYSESVHVPLIVRMPGIAAGETRRIETPVSLVDIAPTILGALDLPSPSSFLGADLAPLMRGGDRGPAFQHVYTEMDHRGRNYEAIRDDRWKLVWKRGPRGPERGSVELYDLVEDPGEQQDLWRSASARPEGRRLAKVLESWGDAVLGEAVASREVALSSLSAETLESLRALGYIGAEDLHPVEEEPEFETEDDLPEVASSALDFTGTAPSEQIENGIVWSGPQAWLHDSASILLRREGGGQSWMVELEIPESSRRSLPLELRGQASGAEPTEIRIFEPGHYVLDGEIPVDGPETLRLTLECKRRERVAADAECARLDRIALR